MFKQERCLAVACTILCSNFLCLVSICSIYMMGCGGIGISIFSNINELQHDSDLDLDSLSTLF